MSPTSDWARSIRRPLSRKRHVSSRSKLSATIPAKGEERTRQPVERPVESDELGRRAPAEPSELVVDVPHHLPGVGGELLAHGVRRVDEERKGGDEAAGDLGVELHRECAEIRPAVGSGPPSRAGEPRMARPGRWESAVVRFGDGVEPGDRSDCAEQDGERLGPAVVARVERLVEPGQDRPDHPDEVLGVLRAPPEHEELGRRATGKRDPHPRRRRRPTAGGPRPRDPGALLCGGSGGGDPGVLAPPC